MEKSIPDWSLNTHWKYVLACSVAAFWPTWPRVHVALVLQRESKWCWTNIPTRSRRPVALTRFNIKFSTNNNTVFPRKSIINRHWQHTGAEIADSMGYGLDGLGSIPGRGKIVFSTAPRAALGPVQPPTQWVSGTLSPRVKRPRREADYSPPSVPWSRMVELYLHSSMSSRRSA
jgi:hypothetical protein